MDLLLSCHYIHVTIHVTIFMSLYLQLQFYRLTLHFYSHSYSTWHSHSHCIDICIAIALFLHSYHISAVLWFYLTGYSFAWLSSYYLVTLPSELALTDVFSPFQFYRLPHDDGSWGFRRTGLGRPSALRIWYLFYSVYFIILFLFYPAFISRDYMCTPVVGHYYAADNRYW